MHPRANDSFTTAPVAALEEEHIPEDISTLEIVKKFVVTGVPLTLATLAQFSIITVILAVVGRKLGVNELGGASLALGLINATAFAFAAGSCGALETVLSHTYGLYKSRGGSGTMHMYGTYVQRMIIILAFISIPIGAILIYIDKFLEYIGQSEQVVYYTGRFCRIAVFGIPSTQIFQVLGRYYACQHETRPLSIVMLVASLFNPIFQILLIHWLGFDGSPVAWLLLFTFVDASLIAHAYWTGLYKKTWGGWDRKAIKNIKALLKLAIPSMAMMMSEWVILEVISVCAGFAEPHELAAFSITMQVFGVCWSIASGVMILVCVLIGNAIGEGKPLLGKRIANVAIVIVAVIAVIDVALCWLLEDRIPFLFTSEEKVVVVYRRLLRYVLPYHLFDTFQSTVMGILRGCGLQKIGAIIIGSALCLVGAPVAFYLFFYLKFGVESLWIGPFFGVVVLGCPSYVYLLYWHIDWSNLKAHEEEPNVVMEEGADVVETTEVVVESREGAVQCTVPGTANE
ncbi:putative membrane transporter protein [Trypanosoma rangeli]|uniref:Putative membrane transporter protein n=1 Tax=Trypanosoma rangeli TaxID=5698 RepID=A0A3R7NUJ8_TRYRA|nr:putative membrane transporter protein [Trypanosoma rangeli]RNF07932.1 putative membrane transporter protein [Trypanosoma rangeli]|eukprot:RNF07932.1 putative membrane transporter protein [Trypanosoma rangeli]